MNPIAVMLPYLQYIADRDGRELDWDSIKTAYDYYEEEIEVPKKPNDLEVHSADKEQVRSIELRQQVEELERTVDDIAEASATIARAYFVQYTAYHEAGFTREEALNLVLAQIYKA